jgi:plastocyanin
MNDVLRFDPDQLTIKVGETVTWTTVGVIPHTSTDDPAKAQNPDHAKLPEGAEPWDSGMLNQGQSFSRTFDVPGEYAYFCIPHEVAGMLATLTVTE